VRGGARDADGERGRRAHCRSGRVARQLLRASCRQQAQTNQEIVMSNHVYKMLELTGSSPTSIEDAVAAAVAKANETIRNIQWFEVTETRGHVKDGKIAHWQVTLKLGFTLE
jgi:flavin-binding protein dodecin